MSGSFAVESSVALAPYTTIGLGGVAAQFVRCTTIQDIQTALGHARTEGLPVHILGGGSNTVFADEGFAGLVIRIDTRDVECIPEQDTTVVIAAAGEPWDELVVQTIERGLAGLECLSGIPGLVGATPMQNVGAYGQEVAQAIEWVEVIDRESGQLEKIKKDDCGFGYRTSRFKQQDAQRYVVVSVAYRLKNDAVPHLQYPQLQAALEDRSVGVGVEALQRVREAVLTLRRGKSMVVDAADPHSRSCGSFFTNPVIPKAALATLQQQYPEAPFFEAEESAHSTAQASWIGTHVKIPAAWCIEHAGFSKGEKRDGIGISPNHPLALVNYGGTTVQLLAFAAEIQQRVKDVLGIELQQEPITIGERGPVSQK